MDTKSPTVAKSGKFIQESAERENQEVPRGRRYVACRRPGPGRRRIGKTGFIDLDEHRETIKNEAVGNRIRSLEIPPAMGASVDLPI